MKQESKALRGLSADKAGIVAVIVRILVESGLLRRAFDYIRELLDAEEEETQE